jgi:superfamily II DNA or RNA helicase
MSFKDLNILSSYDTKRIHEDPNEDPVLFYRDVFSEAVKADFHLGYFSTNAIINIASSFASFIKKGGVVRFITNQYLNSKDIGLLAEFDLEQSNLLKVKETYQDAEKLSNTFKSVSQHFFNCLKYLIDEKKLQIIPVVCKKDTGKSHEEMSHYKIAFFYDNDDNWIYSSGSSNFSFGGLVRNGEKIDVKRNWINYLRTNNEIDNKYKENEEKRTLRDQKRIDDIINNQEDEFQKISKEKLIEVISKRGKSKDLDQLAWDEREIQNEIKKLYKSGRKDLYKEYNEAQEVEFVPYYPKDNNNVSYTPHDYQVEAYENWVSPSNNMSGLFAMATGTGKTWTSLYCALRIYEKEHKFRLLILVPTITLVDQWIEALEQFNYSNITSVSSKQSWESNLDKINNEAMIDDEYSYCIVSTYASFNLPRFQSRVKNLPEDTLFIADEAHNIGSPSSLKLLPVRFNRRIGLSATPERHGDEDGTYMIKDFFNSIKKYTFEYSLEEAIKNNFLCQYEYYPKKVCLTEEESKEYKKYSATIAGIKNNNKNANVNHLLMKRRRIVWKAKNKVIQFENVIKELQLKENWNNKYLFVYTPEGYIDVEKYDDIIDSEELSMIHHEIDLFGGVLSKYGVTPWKRFVGGTSKKERDGIINGFKNGDIPAILSMKCLDEGVDIPRTEFGIFCSSTNNPRQFIQRRGRLLRVDKTGEKKYAIIYDLIVVNTDSTLGGVCDDISISERKIVESELRRAYEFASSAKNERFAVDEIRKIAKENKINIKDII